MIKLFDPSIGKEEEIAIKHVLTSKIWANGAGVGKVSEFESKFRKYTNSKNCIAVNSGTAALNIALSLYDIKDKEVIKAANANRTAMVFTGMRHFKH